jgi:hypothetical protein
MHIADFAYPEEDFKCWCNDHVEWANKGSVVFTLEEPVYVFDYDKQDYTDEVKYPQGHRFAILGPSAGQKGGNHPNLAEKMSEHVV